MEIIITRISNGYLITEEGSSTYCETMLEVLRELSSIEPGSRHDEKRTYVIEAPGDKHPDFTSGHSDVIWGD